MSRPRQPGQRPVRRRALRRERVRRSADRGLLRPARGRPALGPRRPLGGQVARRARGLRRAARRRRASPTRPTLRRSTRSRPGARRAQHRRPVCALRQRARRRLRAPRHALRRHHRRDALGARDDRPPPRRRARRGTRIVPGCGFDSVPSDLGAWRVAQALVAAPRRALRQREGLLLAARRAQRRHVRLAGERAGDRPAASWRATRSCSTRPAPRRPTPRARRPRGAAPRRRLRRLGRRRSSWARSTPAWCAAAPRWRRVEPFAPDFRYRSTCVSAAVPRPPGGGGWIASAVGGAGCPRLPAGAAAAAALRRRPARARRSRPWTAVRSAATASAPASAAPWCAGALPTGATRQPGDDQVRLRIGARAGPRWQVAARRCALRRRADAGHRARRRARVAIACRGDDGRAARPLSQPRTQPAAPGLSARARRACRAGR